MSDHGPSIVAVSPEKSDPPGMGTAVVTLVSIALLLGVLGPLVEHLQHQHQHGEEQRKVIAEQPIELLELEAEQRRELENAPVPLERAMQSVVEEARKGSGE